jgi:hypothetical protein
MILRFEAADYSGPQSIPIWLAKLSYGAYLYHWPLLVIAKYSIGTSTPINILLIAITLLLAFISYNTVERTVTNLKLTTTLAISGFLISILTCAVLIRASSRLSRDYNSLVAQLFKIKPGPIPEKYPCSSETDSSVRECLRPKRTISRPNTIFLLGDSHAGTWFNPLVKQTTNTKYSVRYLNTYSHWGPPGMMNNGEDIEGLKFVTDNCVKGDVLLIAFHRGHLNKSRDKHISLSEKPKYTPNIEAMERTLYKSLTVFSRKGGKVVLIRDTPLLSQVITVSTCALQKKISGTSQCAVSLVQDLHTRSLQDKLFNNIIRAYPEIRSWDPLPLCYLSSTSFDAVSSDGTYTMYDWNHISPYLSQTLSQDLMKYIQSR